MEQDKKNTGLNRRSMASFLLLLSFAALPVSGLLLHAAERGGDLQTRHLYMTIHNSAAFIFTISAFFHAWNNLKAIRSYLLKYWKELVFAIGIASAAGAFACLHVLAAG
jgi:hypothetical protein